jgi:hypothetical protein
MVYIFFGRTPFEVFNPIIVGNPIYVIYEFLVFGIGYKHHCHHTMYHDFTKYFGLIIPKSQSVVEISLIPLFSPVLRQYQKPIAMV